MSACVAPGVKVLWHIGPAQHTDRVRQAPVQHVRKVLLLRPARQRAVRFAARPQQQCDNLYSRIRCALVHPPRGAYSHWQQCGYCSNTRLEAVDRGEATACLLPLSSNSDVGLDHGLNSWSECCCTSFMGVHAYLLYLTWPTALTPLSVRPHREYRSTCQSESSGTSRSRRSAAHRWPCGVWGARSCM